MVSPDIPRKNFAATRHQLKLLGVPNDEYRLSDYINRGGADLQILSSTEFPGEYSIVLLQEQMGQSELGHIVVDCNIVFHGKMLLLSFKQQPPKPGMKKLPTD